jgi:hypothetical protein
LIFPDAGSFPAVLRGFIANCAAYRVNNTKSEENFISGNTARITSIYDNTISAKASGNAAT